MSIEHARKWVMHPTLAYSESPPALPGRQQKFDSYGSPSRKLLIVSRQAHDRRSKMDEFQSLSHSKWECKYHVVFIPSVAERHCTEN